MANSKLYLGSMNIGSAFEGASDISIYLGNNKVYPLGAPSEIHDYLTFEALEDGTFSFSGTSKDSINNYVSYSLDSGTTWTALANGSSTPTIHSGETIQWKAVNHPIGTSADTGIPLETIMGIGVFSSTGEFKAKGNSLSIIYGDNFETVTDFEDYPWAFDGLFKNCTGLTDASGLVMAAENIPTRCYRQLFNGCTSLTKAPTLLGETLSLNCYLAMFQGCTSLINPPQLIARTLAKGCYAEMFRYCTSLTTAPTLPVSVLADDCYDHIFDGCTNLRNVTCLATDITTATTPLSEWLKNVSETGVFYKSRGVEYPRNNSGIPSGWTVVEI